MEKLLLIKDMHCGHCVMAVEKELAKLDLMKYKVEIGSAMIEFDPSQTSEENIKEAIKKAGYTLTNEN